MLLVLLCGAAMGGERLHHRRRAYLDRAAYHAAARATVSAPAKRAADEASALRAFFKRLSRNGRLPCGNLQIRLKVLEAVATEMAWEAAEHRRLEQC
jgi:hypothetical protein